MYQVEVIVKAVSEAIENNNGVVVGAILKHYLLDEDYVPRDMRQHVLTEVNKALNKSYSLSFIKKGNPSVLRNWEGKMPVKVNPVPVTSVSGVTEISVSPILDEHGGEPTRGYEAVQVSPEVTVSGTPTTETQTQSNEEENTEMTNTAAQVEVAMTTETLTVKPAPAKVTRSSDPLSLKKFFKESKETVQNTRKLLTKVIADADSREEAGRAWLKTSKKRKKAFEQFDEHVGDLISKFENKLILFILVGGKATDELAELGKFYSDNAKKYSSDSKEGYTFMRGNDEGIKASWLAAASAVVAGGVNCFMNGTSVGSVGGLAVGAVGAFCVGNILDDLVEGELPRSFLAGFAGGMVGGTFTNIGRNFEEGNGFFPGVFAKEEAGGVTVVVNTPAQGTPDNTNHFSWL